MAHIGKEKGVFIIDDHPVTRRGIAEIVSQEEGLSVCGEAGTLPDARRWLAAVRPDLVLSDLRLCQEDGLEFIRESRTLRADVPVLVVSMLDELTYARRCLEAGASGFVSKSAPPVDLLAAIRESLSGNLWVSQEVTRFLLGTGVQPSELQGARASELGIDYLSNRELQVFRLTGEGVPTRDVASALGISPRTVESHKEHIKRKMGLRTASELSTKAALWLQGQL